MEFYIFIQIIKYYIYIIFNKMSEGPETRLTTDYLNKSLKDKKIIDWVFSGGKYIENYPKGFEEFDKNLPLIVEDVKCKGKFIYFILTNSSGKNFYIFHYLSTGSWQNNYEDHSKWFLEIDNGRTLWFKDPKGFGNLVFSSNKKLLDNKINDLGPDIMRENFHLYEFKNLFEKYTRRNITSFLTDQGIISGCGNYIKSETLYYSNISPLRKCGEISEDEIELIYEGLRIISRISYNKNGLSLKGYRNPNNKKGYFEDNLKIYGKKFSKNTKTADGQITYWNPNIQK
jgi:DNA-formamidopyrimidine glycosylase